MQFRITRIVLSVLIGVAAAVTLSQEVVLSAESAQADRPAAGAAASLERPDWQVGDTWVIETQTDRIQGREAAAAAVAARLRWQFRVVNYEKLAGHDCYRVDIECLGKGRVKPKATMWCDKETLFLRQFQTQVAFDGQYRTIQESYDCPKGQIAPVVASINAVPLGMPAFVPKGAKALDTFTYISQPLPAGSKDPTIVRFAHSVKQQVRPAGAKSLERIPPSYSKALDAKPVTEVTISDDQQTVMQLWQKGTPWPVYISSGRTQAWLVSTGRS